MFTAAPIPRYTVQILLPYAQALDPGVIHRQLLMWREDIESIGPHSPAFAGSFHSRGTRPDHFGFAIPTHDLPLLVHVFHAPPDAYGTQLDDALAWSPTWPDRHTAVAACTSSIVVSMIAHRAVNHATLLLAFLSVLDTVLGCVDDLRSVVLHWLPAQRVLPFAQYRMLRMELGPCGPAVNVRVAPISPTDVIADTVGLTGLGLPDLQTITPITDAAALTTKLLQLARTMFVGDPLDVAWTEQMAIVLPCRDALTVQLDDDTGFMTDVTRHRPWTPGAEDTPR
jgi:hypothetical protein